MIPGRTADEFQPHEDDDHVRDGMLALIDADPDIAALIAIPHADSDDALDALEDDFRRAYDLAKDERPDLAVKLLHGVDVGNGTAESRILVVVHEHCWVGGECVNGCKDKRDVDAA